MNSTSRSRFARASGESAVARVLADSHPAPVAFVGVDRYGTSGKWDELLTYFNLTPERLVAAAREVIARKR